MLGRNLKRGGKADPSEADHSITGASTIASANIRYGDAHGRRLRENCLRRQTSAVGHHFAWRMTRSHGSADPIFCRTGAASSPEQRCHEPTHALQQDGFTE
jgi:hypothetical protein